MQTDASQNKAADLYFLVSGAPQEAGEVINRNETSEGIGYVGVDPRSAVQNQSPERPLGVQVSEVELPQHWIRGKKEIQAHQKAAGARDPLDLTQRHAQVGKIAKTIADEHAIER